MDRSLMTILFIWRKPRVVCAMINCDQWSHLETAGALLPVQPEMGIPSRLDGGDSPAWHNQQYV